MKCLEDISELILSCKAGNTVESFTLNGFEKIDDLVL